MAQSSANNRVNFFPFKGWRVSEGMLRSLQTTWYEWRWGTIEATFRILEAQCYA